MSDEKITVWVTKYALSDGIVEGQAGIGDIRRGSVRVTCCTAYPAWCQTEGKDWHRTKESAIAHAEKMRAKKIASLQRQIAKLEALRFE